VTIRFEFFDVPAAYRKYRILWLLLEQSGADVCAKDPGFPIDIVFRGKVADFVAVYLGHATWHEMQGKAIDIKGDRGLARQLPPGYTSIRSSAAISRWCIQPHTAWRLAQRQNIHSLSSCPLLALSGNPKRTFGGL
jgi:hypothetical protein